MNDIPTRDAFAAFNALIKLAADPGACKARIDRLKRAIDKAAEAEQRLAERSAAQQGQRHGQGIVAEFDAAIARAASANRRDARR